MDKKLIIIHVIMDDNKFFPSALVAFDRDERLVNKCVLIVDSEDEAFQLIEKTDRVKLLVGERQVEAYFSNEVYDAVYFHSMSYRKWPYLKYISSDKKIFWWSWGFDVYNGFIYKPVLPIPLFKPITAKIRPRRKIKEYINGFVDGMKNEKLKRYALKRVDYYQPVVEEEYEMLLKYHKSIHAKEFYKYGRAPLTVNSDLVSNRKPQGYIMVGNSATFTNNHMDVWADLLKLNLQNRIFILPLNYGNDSYGDFVERNFVIPGNHAFALREFMPKDEYFSLMNNCSYAIYGVIRQQAMGNVYQCLRQGLKVFLYKDSVVYKDLVKHGFVVYTIEDMDEAQLSTPITLEEHVRNIEAFGNLRERRKHIYENVINELLATKEGC